MKKKNYAKSLIAVITAPALIITGAICFVTNSIYSNMETERLEKKTIYDGDKSTEEISLIKAKKASKLEPSVTLWEKRTVKEAPFTFGQIIQNKMSKFERNTFQVVGQTPSNGGSLNEINQASFLDISLRGTYKNIQLAFLEVEKEMPNTTCFSYNIKESSGKTLNLKTKFVIWHN